MINLALVSHSPYLYGAERSLVSLAEMFCNKRGSFFLNFCEIHPILLIPPPEHEAMANLAKSAGISMIHTQYVPWYIWKSPESPDEFEKYCSNIRDCIKIYIDIFRKIKADIVLVNTLTNFIPHIAAYILRLPVVTWIHGVLEPSIISGIDANYKSVIDRGIINLSNKLIFCSNWTEKRFEHIAEKNSFVTIPNWANEPNNWEICNGNENTFVCLNSMEEAKGVNILLEAAKLLKDRGYFFQVSLFAQEHEYMRIMLKINDLGLSDIVLVTPRTIDIGTVYSNCIALIQPSFYESFGRTIIEAMSYKKPVIAANSADPEKLVMDGVSGFHFETGNAAELSEKMEIILINKKSAENMGKKGYKIYRSKYNGNIAKKKFTRLLYSLYYSNMKPTPLQEFTFDSLNLIHKNSFT